MDKHILFQHFALTLTERAKMPKDWMLPILDRAHLTLRFISWERDFKRNRRIDLHLRSTTFGL